MGSMGLTDEQKIFYRENGFVLVKGLLGKSEAAAYRAECHALAQRLARVRNIDATWATVRGTVNAGKKTEIYHCHDVQFQAAAFGRLIVDERLAGVAQDIIGPNVQLHHTKMFIKPPEKGSPFPMHQDVMYFEHERHTMIAAIVHFDDAPVAKGCLRVVPGSHKLGVLKSDRADHSLSPEEYPIERALPIEAEAGDAVFFSYLTIHGSGVNVSAEARTTVLIQMRDPEDRPLRREHESRGQGVMLAGMDPSCGMVRAVGDTAKEPQAAGMGMGMG